MIGSMPVRIADRMLLKIRLRVLKTEVIFDRSVVIVSVMVQIAARIIVMTVPRMR